MKMPGGKYRPYAPKKNGITIEQAEKIAGVKTGQSEVLTREVLEVAIRNAKQKYGYEMRGTLDAALASGAIPCMGSTKGPEDTTADDWMLLGWIDAKGNAVLV
jgi:hypothetical protein